MQIIWLFNFVRLLIVDLCGFWGFFPRRCWKIWWKNSQVGQFFSRGFSSTYSTTVKQQDLKPILQKIEPWPHGPMKAPDCPWNYIAQKAQQWGAHLFRFRSKAKSFSQIFYNLFGFRTEEEWMITNESLDGRLSPSSENRNNFAVRT